MTHPPSPHRLCVETVLLFTVICATLSLASRGVGVTWDESSYFRFSDSINRWFDQGHRFDQATLERHWNYNSYLNPHPPLMKIASAVSARAFGDALSFPLSYRLAHHAFEAVCLTVVYALLRSVASGLAASSAIALILLQPRVFGDLMLGTTDGPVAMVWLTASVLAWKTTVAENAAAKAGYRVLLALATAVGAATKFTGLLVIAPLGLYHLVRGRIREALHVAVAGFMALASVALVSPDKWRFPVTAAVQYLTYPFTRESVPIYTFYFGEVYFFHVPWHYFAVVSLITVPPALWLLLLGLSRIPVSLRRLVEPVVCALGFWLVLVHLPNTPRHDGVREFLAVYPLLGILFWAGLQGIAAWITARSPGRGHAVWPGALGLAVTSMLALEVWQSHPHELSYYNGVIGGIRGAERRGMEISYYLESIGPDMVQAINREVGTGKTLYMTPSWTNLLDIYQEHGQMRRDFVLLPVVTATRPDYFLIVRRRALIDDDWYVRQPALYEVSYDGVSLAKLVRVDE